MLEKKNCWSIFSRNERNERNEKNERVERDEMDERNVYAIGREDSFFQH